MKMKEYTLLEEELGVLMALMGVNTVYGLDLGEILDFHKNAVSKIRELVDGIQQKKCMEFGVDEVGYLDNELFSILSNIKQCEQYFTYRHTDQRRGTIWTNYYKISDSISRVEVLNGKCKCCLLLPEKIDKKIVLYEKEIFMTWNQLELVCERVDSFDEQGAKVLLGEVICDEDEEVRKDLMNFFAARYSLSRIQCWNKTGSCFQRKDDVAMFKGKRVWYQIETENEDMVRFRTVKDFRPQEMINALLS